MGLSVSLEVVQSQLRQGANLLYLELGQLSPAQKSNYKSSYRVCWTGKGCISKQEFTKLFTMR